MVFRCYDFLDVVVAVFAKKLDKALLALLASLVNNTVLVLLSMPYQEESRMCGSVRVCDR